MRNLSYFYNLPWGNLIAKIWGFLLSTYTIRDEPGVVTGFYA